ncbi:MAG TPA: BamA/TamA family outer membrane protein [Casimicrobiaceae bacterium]|nr:BamA/TamA family outer membrane protein [Casimicrobiaceae bacterium]
MIDALPLPARVPRSACRWLRALILAAAPLLAPSVEAADAPPPSESGASKEPAYRVVIDAPSPLNTSIERNVGLARWQSYADMTPELLERLAAEAREEIRNIAAAEGYFSASVDIKVDGDAKPPVVTITVAAGEPTRISDVSIEVTGAANSEPLGTAAIAKLRDEWGLPMGQVFRQAVWDAAKGRALATLRASPYAAAKIVRSRADIDPVSLTAALAIELDSGPEFKFGDFEVQGLSKYTPSMVKNYSSIRRGEPYNEAALEQFIRNLNSSGYFSSVQASIDTASANPEDATVRVSVIEARPKTFEGGIGYSTDLRYTAKISYRDVNIDGHGLQMLFDAQYDAETQGGSLRFVQPANASGWIGIYMLAANQTDIEGLRTKTASAGTRWNTIDVRRERALSAIFYDDEQRPDGAPSSHSHALYLEAEQYLRETDVLLSPTRGWMASVQLGGGIPGASTRGFGRVIGRYAAWLPIDSLTELTFRADAGAVLAPTRDGIPSPLLFRTGGDTTVRGYAFDSLGVKLGNATVGGRYYAVGSTELIRWIGESWGLATFIDAGNATDEISGFHFAIGYGAGVRVRTPLGPFRLDVAYGRDSHEVRLHFSVGLSF